MALPLKSQTPRGTTSKQRGYLDSQVNRGLQSTTQTTIAGEESVIEIHQPQPQLHYDTHARCRFLDRGPG